MSNFDRALRNMPPQDPEQPDVHFYQVTTTYGEAMREPETARDLAGLPPGEFYDRLLSTWRMGRLGAEHYISSVIDATWYDYLQPEYKAYPSIVTALAATSIDIGCEHLRMPFPAFAIRLPEGFVQEEGGPPIRSLLIAMMRNTSSHSSRPVTSIGSEVLPNSREIPFAITAVSTDRGGRFGSTLGMPLPKGTTKDVLVAQIKFTDRDGDDAFANFSIGLEEGKTIEESFEYLRFDRPPGYDDYFPSPKLAREMLSLAVGVSFFATGRHKSARPIIQTDRRPRVERRRFEKENDGQEQPTFSVGRELMLPRAEGVPAAEQGEHGEGSGRQLKFAHLRTGHLRYQAFGPGMSERKLVFIEPTIVRSDLPLRPRTPGAITGDRPARDVTLPRQE